LDGPLFLAVLGLAACTAELRVVNLSDEPVRVSLATVPPSVAVLAPGQNRLFEKIPCGLFDPDLALEATGDWIEPQRRRLILFARSEASYAVTNNLTWLVLSNLDTASLSYFYIWPAALGSNYLATSNQLADRGPLEAQKALAIRMAMGGGPYHLRAGGPGPARSFFNAHLSNFGRTLAVVTPASITLNP